MINKIRNFFFSFFKIFLPEIVILKKEINWRYYEDYIGWYKVSEKAKIGSPHRLIHISIGDYTYIGENANVLHTDIGKFCSIGPNFFCGWGIHPTSGISTSPMFYSTNYQNGYSLSKEDKVKERKQIVIGNDVFIGANVTVLDGITIGDGAVIGAGAVVSKDIPPYAIAVGSPIEIIKYRFTQEQIDALLKIEWWNFPEERLSDIESMFFDIDSFIKKYEE